MIVFLFFNGQIVRQHIKLLQSKILFAIPVFDPHLSCKITQRVFIINERGDRLQKWNGFIDKRNFIV